MSGHSKWSKIKRKKGASDAKRGKIFTKLIKELTIAARMGGGDSNTNARLRKAIADAKAQNMPSDNIERAIKKGTGDLEGVRYEEFTMEGYGPGGVAILVQIQSDNKNRTIEEIRHIFTKYNANLGEAGCVSWMFEKKGIIAFDKTSIEEDKLMEIGLDAGAEDIKDKEDSLEVITTPQGYEKVKKAFDSSELKYELADIAMIPQTYITLDGKDAETMVKLVEALEDSDDVQTVWTNSEISDEAMKQIEATQ